MGWLAIINLPIYIVSGQALVYLWTMVNPSALNHLILNPYAVLQRGEYWRLFTTLFVGPVGNTTFNFVTNPIITVFYLYLLYIYGEALEHEWGSFGFTLFYLVGAIGTMAATFLGAYAAGTYGPGAFYLNLTIFLAFAALNPDFIIQLFFIFPIKIKWLGLFIWVGLVYEFLTSSFVNRVAILAAVGNYFLFLSKMHFEQGKEIIRLYQHKQKFRNWKG